MERRVVRVGTRKSPLALWQTRWVIARLAEVWPQIQFEEVPMVTQGDLLLDRPLDQAGGRGLFVAEMEEALLEGAIDLAIHSMKDLPIDLALGLTLGPVPPRADPRDLLVSRHGWQSLDQVPEGARVGTSSPRRKAQLLAQRPDLQIFPVRGNLGTRLRKLDEGQVDGLVLAAAGLARLGYQVPGFPLDPPGFLPAVGQGALGVELRADDTWLLERLAPIGDRAATAEVAAERAFLKSLGGGCHLPIAGWSQVVGEHLTLLGRVISPDGSRQLEEQIAGGVEEAAALGQRLGERLLARGAADLF